MTTVCIILLLTCFTLLAWRDVKFALVLLTGLLPTYLIRFSIGPFPTTLLELLILICVAVYLLHKLSTTFTLRDPWFCAGLLLIATASFGVAVAPDHVSAFGIWKAYFVEPFAVFYMMRMLFSPKEFQQTFMALAVSGAVVSLFALVQYATGHFIPAPWDLERRVTSVFDFPNAVGLFLAPVVAMSAVFLIAIFQTKKHLDTKVFRMGQFCITWENTLKAIFWIVSMALGLEAIFLSKTEAAFVAIPVALLLTLLVSAAPKPTKILSICIAGCLLIIAILIPSTRTKILLQDSSGHVRFSQWHETAQLMAHNPAFGAGLNAYPQALAPYHNSTQYEIFQYPHNIVLNIWTELGLLGLIAFGLLAWLTWRSVTPTTKNSQQKTLLLAAFAALLTMTIHGLVDVPYFKNDLSVMVWILFAVLATTSHANKTTDVRTPQQNFSQHLPTLLPRSTHGQTGIRQTSGFNHIEIYPNTGTVESRVENLTANSVAFEKVVRPQSYNL